MKWVPVFIIILFVSCTNWKAAYIEKSFQLKECINSPPEAFITYKTVKETITDTVKIITPVEKIIMIDNTPGFKPIEKFFFSVDSTKIFLQIKTKVLAGKLIQNITVDSLIVRERTIRETKTITVEKEITSHLWRDIAAGLFVVSVFASIIAVYSKRTVK